MKTIYRHATLATIDHAHDYGLIEDGALVTDSTTGLIEWVGKDSAIPMNTSTGSVLTDTNEIDLQGALLTPALIDCHTHLVYGGQRSNEFEMRLHGATYEDIARAGGGIRSTVTATRAASEDVLYAIAKKRAQSLILQGAGTIEIKSGYGLDFENERKMLLVARRLGGELGITVKTTYLAAHALPQEFAERPDDYISAVCAWMQTLNSEHLIDAVDVFCERIAFDLSQTERVFAKAKSLGLSVKLHAEQLSNMEGAALATKFGALSCDHLEHLSEAGITAMKSSGTVAVLLPGAFYFLRETKQPPIQAMRDAGLKIAIATDHNPGSSPALNPTLMMSMACKDFKLTPQEALRGMTVNAAAALGLADRGVVAAGKRSDLAVWDVQHPSELSYWFGGNPCKQLIVGGKEYRFK